MTTLDKELDNIRALHEKILAAGCAAALRTLTEELDALTEVNKKLREQISDLQESLRVSNEWQEYYYRMYIDFGAEPIWNIGSPDDEGELEIVSTPREERLTMRRDDTEVKQLHTKLTTLEALVEKLTTDVVATASQASKNSQEIANIIKRPRPTGNIR